jgi:hypothetical protein
VGATDVQKIVDAMKHFEPHSPKPEIFGDGKAAQRIVDALVSRYGNQPEPS